MKKFALLLTGIVLMLVLVGCGKKATPTYTDEEGNVQQKTVLNFFGWGSVEEQRIFKTMIAEFNKLYPKYQVVYKSVTANNYITTLASYKNNPRNMPDVFYMPDVSFVQWIYSTDIMLDLTPYIEKSTVFTLENVWREGIRAYQFDKNTQKLGVGGIYALPKDLGPNMLVYNKNLVLEAGVTIVSDKEGTEYPYGYDPERKILNDQIPMTWAQFIAFCQDTKKGELDQSDAIVGITHYPLETAYFSIGGDFLSPDRKTVTIANDKFAEALQFVADLSNKFEVMTTAEGQSSQAGFQRFSSGLAVSSFVGAWDTPELWHVDFDWDILHTPVPNQNGDLTDWRDGYRKGAGSISYLGSVGIAVYSKTKDPEGAYLLAEFLTVHPYAQRINYKLGQAVPNLIDMARGEFLTEELEDPKGWNRPKNREVYIKMIESSPRRPQANTYTDEWFQEMWDSSTDSLKLFRVWSKAASAYGGHVDVWDWETKQRINNSFLNQLEDEMQEILDRTKDRYTWSVE